MLWPFLYLNESLQPPKELSRREREEKQKKDAKEHYQKLHAVSTCCLVHYTC